MFVNFSAPICVLILSASGARNNRGKNLIHPFWKHACRWREIGVELVFKTHLPIRFYIWLCYKKSFLWRFTLQLGLKSCKHLLFVVVVLCSGNKKLTKNNKNAAFHSHRAAAFLSVVFFLLAVAIATPLSGRYASVIGRAAHATLRSWASKLSGSAWGRGWTSGRRISCMTCALPLAPATSLCIRESLRVWWKSSTGLAQTSRLSIKEQVMRLLHLRWQVSCYRWIGLQPPKSLLCAGTP